MDKIVEPVLTINPRSTKYPVKSTGNNTRTGAGTGGLHISNYHKSPSDNKSTDEIFTTSNGGQTFIGSPDLFWKATTAVGGTVVQNSFSTALGDQVTVHPIGHAGQLYIGDGDEVYLGLMVTDAAVIPAASGANPFATTTALAERTLDTYAKRKKLVVKDERNDHLNLFATSKYPTARRKGKRLQPLERREEEETIYYTYKLTAKAHRLNDDRV
ncbi:hypothetical protein F5Y01DRAFT_310749 [Xylaria sp. FL0043]|nr:hypothetical protein F5Y01DRAFT_310749 [Xylaria sp. FL0043]